MAGWRGTDGSSRRRKPPRDGGVRSERRAAAEPRKAILRNPNERQVRGDAIWYNRLAWAMLAMVLMAITIGVILWMPRPLPLLACVVNYSDDGPLIPPNAFAASDVQRFLGLDAAAGSFRSRKPAFASLHELLEYLKRPDRKPGSLLAPGFGGGPGKHELVIYVSAHGVVNSQGEPCLLDAGVNPLDDSDPSKWRTVKAFLADLEARVPADVRRVVLLLDSGRAEVSWTLGWLDPSFPEKLAAVWDDVKPKRFWLVHSRGAADQRNWTSPKLQASTFGLHAVRALSRAADENGDGKIAFAEFCQHLDRELAKWVRTYRASTQQIQVLAANSKPFLLAQAAPAPASPPPADDSGLVDVQPLTALWSDVDELRAHEPWRTQPLAWAKLQRRLLDAELLWLAGRESQSAFSNAIASARELRDVLRQSPESASVPAGCPLWTPPAWLPASTDSATPAWDELLQASGNDLPGQLLQAANKSERSIEAAYARLVANYVDFSTADLSRVKDLLRLRHSAEVVAALPGVLAWPVVQQQILEADNRRRQLEDAAWVGGPAQWQKIAADLPQVHDAYQEADTIARAWLERLRQRDQMLAELPWLLRWAEVERDATLLKSLLDARRTLWEFRDAFLDVKPPGAASDDWNGIWKTFLEARNRFEERCRPVDQSALNAAFVPKALRLLQVPLTAGNRELLLTGLEQQLSKDGEQASVPGATSDELPSLEERLPAKSELQPLLALLSTDMAEVLKVPAHEAGGKVRQQFRNSEHPDRKPFGALDEQLKSVRRPDPKKPATAVAREWRDVEWLGRAWAAVYPQGCQVVGEPAVAVDDAISAQAELLQGLFGIWQAERVLRDFYGSADPIADPLFAAPASWWLDFASRTKLLRTTIDQCRSDLNDLKNISRNLLAISLKAPQQEAGDLKSPQEVQATFAGPAIPARVSEPLNPSGAAAAWLELEAPGPRRQLRPVPLVGRHRVSAEAGIGLRQENLRKELGGENWKLPIDELFAGDAKEARLSAVLFFRGHLMRSSPLTLKAPVVDRGIRRNYEAPPDQLATSIRVNGVAQPRLWLMIVLDCSGSMGQKLNLAADKFDPDRDRFSVARSNLLSTLRDLRDTVPQGTVQLAFMAYGSQVGLVGVKVPKDPKVPDGEQETKYVKKYLVPGEKVLRDDPPANSSLHPATDVRLWVDFQTNKPLEKQADEIIAKIEELQPLGVTPLYLSVQRAVERLRALDTGQDPKVVLVITDGVNEVYPTEPKDCERYGLPVPPADELVSKAQLESYLDREGKDVDVRIVGFAMESPQVLLAKAERTQNPDDARKFRRDALELQSLEQLCRTRDGQDHPRRRLKYDEGADSLVDELKRLVPKVQFEVLRGGQSVGYGLLGQQVKLDGPGRYVVRVSGRYPKGTPPLTLHGGEELVLTYSEGPPPSLTFARYPEVLNEETTEGSVARHDQWWVAALPRDTQHSDPAPGVKRFRIAVQPPPQPQTAFPDRPGMVAAIVYPQERRGASVKDLPPEAAAPYVFFPSDVQFESQRPSPVLILEAGDWPVQATAARIKLWLRPPGSDLPKSFSQNLGELEAGELELPPELSRVVRLQLGKTESRDDGTTVLRLQQVNRQADWLKTGNPVWVHLQPSPRRWSRTFFLQENRIEHEFVLERYQQQEFRLLATPLEWLQRDDSRPGSTVELELTGIRVPEK